CADRRPGRGGAAADVGHTTAPAGDAGPGALCGAAVDQHAAVVGDHAAFAGASRRPGLARAAADIGDATAATAHARPGTLRDAAVDGHVAVVEQLSALARASRRGGLARAAAGAATDQRVTVVPRHDPAPTHAGGRNGIADAITDVGQDGAARRR